MPTEPSTLATAAPGPSFQPHRIPFNRPVASPRAAVFVNEVLGSERLAGIGPFGRRCEQLLTDLAGAHRTLLTPSCTHALEMSALLLDAQPGDEVLVPSFTFVSTANAFAVHGLQPVFVDCDPATMNLDPAKLASAVTSRTRAVVAMHYGGVACDLDVIAAFARQHDLMLVEDNAHGLFGRYKGRSLGSIGSLATQSFDETKNITCGQGGALLVNDPALAERADVLRQRGTNRSRFYRGEVDKYSWVDLGSNWVLSELHAALLWGHLAEREAIQERRQRVWARYHEELRAWAAANDVGQPQIPDYAEHPAHLYYLLLPTSDARDRLILHLRERSIQSVFHYGALNVSEMGQRLGGKAGQCPVAEHLSTRLLRLPFFDSLSLADQTEVIGRVCEFRV